MKIAYICVILVLLFSTPALAKDKIILKNGNVMECRILEYKPNGIMIEFSGAKMLMRNTDIARIIVPIPSEIKNAKSYFDKENYPKAIAQYEKALARYNEYSYSWKEDAYFTLVRCYIKEKKLVEAQKSLDDILREFKTPQANQKIKLGQAELLLAKKDFSKARSAYIEIIETYSREKEILVQACYYLGECLAGAGENEEALIAFLKVEMFYYDYPEWRVKAKFRSGEMAEVLKNWERAKWTYEELIEEFPDSSYARKAKEKLAQVVEKIKE